MAGRMMAASRGEKRRRTATVLCVLKEEVRHRMQTTPACPCMASSYVALAGIHKKRRGVDGGKQEVALLGDSEKITKLPLCQILKLLSNFLKKLKIYKNKGCSTFQVLQLYF
jgi:hypothetical protein